MTGEYVARVAKEGTAFATESRLPADAALREKVMLALRLARGVAEPEWDEARATLGREDRERLADREEAGLLERREGRVRLTRRGVLLSNEVFALLL
jgi:oxygen-independent coproporphyrinogen-3 oxidase